MGFYRVAGRGQRSKFKGEEKASRVWDRAGVAAC